MPKEAFTNSSSFAYVESFLMGLNLQRQFLSAEYCQNNIFYAMDEWTMFQNNFTETFVYTPADELKPFLPLMRFLETVGGNFSEAFPHCYDTTREIIAYWNEIQEATDNLGQLFRYYMLSQFTYAVSYKKAFERIDANNLA